MNQQKYTFENLNEISFDKGFCIGGTVVKGIQQIEIKSDDSDVSQITLKFVGKVKGLDGYSDNQ
ncbi:hypothetical protein MHI57_17945 [Cytobacillus sp. FSL K6-0129]|uniref:hypothetical protein n=1 Tax=Cytobacillus sp. FSL K6-0129 TaxID=2921421 RepID=UPI0030FB15C4